MAKKKKEMIVPIGRYIDPLTDFGFKKIFNSEPNKDLLIAFLNVHRYSIAKAWIKHG